MTIRTSDKVDFTAKSVTKYKERHFTEKGSTDKENIIIISVYEPNMWQINKLMLHMISHQEKQNLSEIQLHIH